MPKKALNRRLHAARATKQDEFYTQLSDIEKELKHYTRVLSILCFRGFVLPRLAHLL